MIPILTKRLHGSQDLARDRSGADRMTPLQGGNGAPNDGQEVWSWRVGWYCSIRVEWRALQMDG